MQRRVVGIGDQGFFRRCYRRGRISDALLRVRQDSLELFSGVCVWSQARPAGYVKSSLDPKYKVSF
jgi:hypothetical protein